MLPDSATRLERVGRFFATLTRGERAATFDISTGTVKSQIARALARMGEVLSTPEPATREMELACLH
jgi:DNA-directed RNA polymerase specialized sigma24 family protein